MRRYSSLIKINPSEEEVLFSGDMSNKMILASPEDLFFTSNYWRNKTTHLNLVLSCLNLYLEKETC